jgi:hypothetical protein
MGDDELRQEWVDASQTKAPERKGCFICPPKMLPFCYRGRKADGTGSQTHTHARTHTLITRHTLARALAVSTEVTRHKFVIRSMLLCARTTCSVFPVSKTAQGAPPEGLRAALGSRKMARTWSFFGRTWPSSGARPLLRGLNLAPRQIWRDIYPYNITQRARAVCDIISAALRFRLGLPGMCSDPPTCIYHSNRCTLRNKSRRSDIV